MAPCRFATVFILADLVAGDHSIVTVDGGPILNRAAATKRLSFSPDVEESTFGSPP
jgi:hypothetical protein